MFTVLGDEQWIGLKIRNGAVPVVAAAYTQSPFGMAG
jgi:hypothetical protein